MIVGVHGCGCAPDETIRWLVVALLGVAGTAVLAAGWRLDRRRRRASSPAGATPGADPRRRAERSAPTVAGVLIFGLAIFVAFVHMASDPALVVLALGATVGTAGIGLGATRTLSATETTPR
ncbi:MAG TPA: hypothetical protein VLV81_07860 [Acidimicrobiia bacterium]|nr:hypothetical protein [Acidimicrobiia bacterium]